MGTYAFQRAKIIMREIGMADNELDEIQKKVSGSLRLSGNALASYEESVSNIKNYELFNEPVLY
jgi:hypothetical protein